MESIRSLYFKIKSSNEINERSKIEKLYSEAVDNVFKNQKKNILSHPDLEYIVSCKNGLEQFDQFIERYGLPIQSFDNVYNIIKEKKMMTDQTNALYKSDRKQIMFEKYSDVLEKLDLFKSRWYKAFIMFENKMDPKYDYNKIYYEYAIDRKINPKRLLAQYGIGIVPDLIIFNNKFTKNDAILEAVLSDNLFYNLSNAQWMFESMEPYSKDSIIYKKVFLSSFDRILCHLLEQEKKVYLESIIMQKPLANEKFNGNEIEIINDYIKFKKNILNSKINPSNKILIESQIQKAEDLKYKIENSADVVSDFLQSVVTEGLWNKDDPGLAGETPDYIKSDEPKMRDKPKNKSYEDDDFDNGMKPYERKRNYDDWDEPSSSSDLDNDYDKNTRIDIDDRPESDPEIGDRIANGIEKFGRNVGKVFDATIKKPFDSLVDGAKKMANAWKNMSDNQIKEILLDPSKEHDAWANVRRLIKAGLLVQTGLIFNPLIWYYQLTKIWARRGSNVQRVREDLTNELEATIEVAQNKIDEARSHGNHEDLEQLIRWRKKLELMLARLGGHYINANQSRW